MRRKQVVLTAFDKFLWFDTNPSIDILRDARISGAAKMIMPVGYFQRDFIEPLESNPDVYIALGLWEGNYWKVETRARNEYVTLKNPVVRFGANAVIRILKIFGKNLALKTPPKKESLTCFPIECGGPAYVTLHAAPARSKGVRVSTDAGNYVCNYLAWCVERRIQQKRLSTNFYFIHVPANPTKAQKKDLLTYIRKLAQGSNPRKTVSSWT